MGFQKVHALADERNAVILAHNYQVPWIQDVADIVGDSLELSRQAAATDADVIVFCGVHFMAETAKILSYEKTVLLPDLGAGCSLAASITADQLRAWKAEHPGAVVVSYVNTTAEVKAETDYCCTSANAARVVRRSPADKEILFLPGHVPGRPRRAGHRPQDAHLDGGVPRPRRHQPGRYRTAGSTSSRKPTSTSTPSAAAHRRRSTWRRPATCRPIGPTC